MDDTLYSDDEISIANMLAEGKTILHFESLPWRYSDLSIYSYVNASTLLSSESCRKGFDVDEWFTQTLCCHWRLWWTALRLKWLNPGRIRVKFHNSNDKDIWALSDKNNAFISLGA